MTPSRHPRRPRGAFVLALSLLMVAVMFLVTASVLTVAPVTLQSSTLAVEKGNLVDLALSGLADAEVRLLQDPATPVNFTGSLASGSYSVVMTSASNSVRLRSSGTDAAGRTLTVLREVGLGSAAMRYLLCSDADTRINLGIGNVVKGSIYGYTGATVQGAAVHGAVETSAGSGPKIKIPDVDWFDYKVMYGFDQSTGSNTFNPGDYRDKRIIFVDGNCTINQNALPVYMKTLIVRGSLSVQGTVPTFAGRTSFTPDTVGGRMLPAIICYGNISASSPLLSPVLVNGVIWCGGSVNWQNLVLRGTCLAKSTIGLTGTSTDLDQTVRLFWDPMLYPPYLRPNPEGLFLTRMNQQFLKQ